MNVKSDPRRTGVKAVLHDFDEWPEFAEPGLCQRFAVQDNGCVLHHTCPGCGRFGGISIGFGQKPKSPSWQLMSGDPADPTTWTLAPSIHCVGCCGWHGYLRNGVFESC